MASEAARSRELPAATGVFRTRHGAAVEFSRLGFGCAPVGNLYRAISDVEARAALDCAWESGCRYFDVAPLYGLGLAETRLGAFLRDRRDHRPTISTKVGRYLVRTDPASRDAQDGFIDVPARRVVYDYSHAGVMRSLEQSFERLGVDRIDVLLCHDVDVTTHGSVAESDARIDEFMEGGYRALLELRRSGDVSAIGAGVNDWEVAEKLARRGDFDLFLVAGRYTLLEQGALDTFLPYCEQQGIGVIAGGPYNSGILATGARNGAFYNYAPAPGVVLERVRRIESVCERHGVPLPAAALQFVLAHPAVVSVIPGGGGRREVTQNAAFLQTDIPARLWADLKSESLLRPDAPVPRVP
jgi:D-threo-aldose 1-dehydrogenase